MCSLKVTRSGRETGIEGFAGVALACRAPVSPPWSSVERHPFTISEPEKQTLRNHPRPILGLTWSARL